AGVTDCSNFFGIGTGGSGGTPVSTALALGTVTTGGSSYPYFTNVTGASASGGMTWGDLSFTITNSTGGAESSALVFSIFGPSGCGIARGTVDSNFYGPPSVTACSG